MIAPRCRPRARSCSASSRWAWARTGALESRPESPYRMTERAAAVSDAPTAASALQEVPADGLDAGAATAHQEVLVLDFGGQYSQLIARRIRECGVFAELLPHDLGLDQIRARSPRALVLSGGPASVYSEERRGCAPSCSSSESRCSGSVTGCRRWCSSSVGGSRPPSRASSAAPSSRSPATAAGCSPGLPPEQQCWMSHRDCVFEAPDGFTALAASPARRSPRSSTPARAVRDPVPPRGRPHALRAADPGAVPARDRSLRAALVACLGDR